MQSMCNISEQAVFDTLKYQVEVDKNGMRRYYNKAGQLHRDDGPAAEWNGVTFWYQNGHYHRTDGPAIQHADGTTCWYQNGQRHRTDGPAIELADGRKWWYLNDRSLTEDEFNQAVKQYE